jgi:tetratricopeptide (TPR) repeat protein
MINLEPTPPSRERIAELQELVDRHGELVAAKIDAAYQQADALKLLAQEYIRQQLYGPALDTLEEAVRVAPRNHVLHYLTGIAAGYLGTSQSRADLRERYLAQAERAYQLAVEIEPSYIDGLYGLAVLYVFELEEPMKALPHLERILELSEGHVPSLFVLARAHVALGNIDEALTAYDRVIATAADSRTQERADRNRRLLLGGSP